jgi:hypothetical protein
MTEVPEKWAEQLRFDYGFAVKALKKSGSVSQMAVLHDRDGQSVTPIILKWLDREVKTRGYSYLSLLAEATEPAAFSFISEAWLRVVQRRHGESVGEHNTRALEGPRPSEAEDRIEIIYAMVIWRDDAGERQAAFKAGDIERDASGTVSSVKPRATWKVDDSIVGDVIGIMPEEAVSPSRRAEAIRLISAGGEAMALAAGCHFKHLK